MMLEKLKSLLPFFFLSGLLAVFFLLPNSNLTIDSWYYAACVKHQNDIFGNSHHLFYNYFGLQTWHLINFIHPVSAANALLLMNAFAASISLLLFIQIIKIAGYSLSNAIILAVLAASSFGFLRFATDAETYVLPIMWTLASAYAYLKSNTLVNTFLAGVFAVLAICTHQLQIWWALALIIHTWKFSGRGIRHGFLLTSILLITPLIYYQFYVVGRYCNVSFIGFLLGQYSSGGAGIDISIKALVLTLINFLRTFLQVHGQIGFLFNQYFVSSCLVVITLAGLVYLAFTRRQEILKIEKKNSNHRTAILFLLTAIFNILFAFLSSGNAEFMAMLPFLLIAFMAFRYQLTLDNTLIIPALIMLVWNLCSGIIPSACLNISRTDTQVKFYKQHSEALFVFENKAQVENQFCYLYGFEDQNRFIKLSDITQYLDSAKSIYTDLGNINTKYSRAALLKNHEENDLLSAFTLIKSDSFQNLYGKNYIYLVRKKDEKAIFAP